MWRCAGLHGCGETFTAWAAAERHADGHGHHRLDLVVESLGRAR